MSGILNNKSNHIFQSREKMHIAACFFMMFGLIIFPMHIRYGLLKGMIKIYARIDFFFIIGLGILLYLKTKANDFSFQDKLMKWLWLFCGVLVLCANYSQKTSRTVVVLCNLLLPLFLVLYRCRREEFQCFIRSIIICFDIFVVGLLFYALFEKFTDSMILRYVAQKLSSGEYEIYLHAMTLDVWRAHSLWGHALLSSVFFNAFFIINDLYFVSIKKKYPKILFFMIALLGVLLCASRTAIVVLMAYFLVSSWKNKKLLAVCGILLVIVFVAGGFDSLIERMMNFSLTSGRAEMLKLYIESGKYPLRFLIGYGSNTVYDTALYDWRSGFEFPIIMSALDHGILFAVLVYLGLYGYVSYQMLKRKKIQYWLGYSLLYAQLNTFNGLGLYNQDTFTWLCLVSMIAVNCAVFSEGSKESLEANHEDDGEDMSQRVASQ